MKAKVLIDGAEVQEPNGIKGLTQEIQFVNEYRGLFTYITGDLDFYAVN